MGLVVEKTLVSIQGTKLKSDGPLLVTHWGMSGPAILKLSAFGAKILNEKNYNFKIQVNWVHESNNEKVEKQLREIIKTHPKKLVSNIKPYLLPERIWEFIIEKSLLSKDKKWEELGNKGINKFVNLLTNDIYSVKGKTTFKEEFVTCGGVNIDEVNLNTMESKICKGLYFAGEILDIDAITGGYNFQAAWSTGFIAGKLNST
jgi:predicted Rossmann fold flavoprotein